MYTIYVQSCSDTQEVYNMVICSECFAPLGYAETMCSSCSNKIRSANNDWRPDISSSGSAITWDRGGTGTCSDGRRYEKDSDGNIVDKGY